MKDMNGGQSDDRSRRFYGAEEIPSFGDQEDVKITHPCCDDDAKEYDSILDSLPNQKTTTLPRFLTLFF